jgi:hypothetical protein
MQQEATMYKGLSYSPEYGSFAFGTNPGPSDLEYSITDVATDRREAKIHAVILLINRRIDRLGDARHTG